MGCDLASPVQYVKGVGPQRARFLPRLGINTFRDALFHLPYRYEDRSTLTKIAELAPHQLDTGLNTISGKVVSSEIITPNPRRPRLRLFELVIADGSGALKAKWFNQVYLKKLFK